MEVKPTGNKWLEISLADAEIRHLAISRYCRGPVESPRSGLGWVTVRVVNDRTQEFPDAVFGERDLSINLPELRLPAVVRRRNMRHELGGAIVNDLIIVKAKTETDPQVPIFDVGETAREPSSDADQ